MSTKLQIYHYCCSRVDQQYAAKLGYKTEPTKNYYLSMNIIAITDVMQQVLNSFQKKRMLKTS